MGNKGPRCSSIILYCSFKLTFSWHVSTEVKKNSKCQIRCWLLNTLRSSVLLSSFSTSLPELPFLLIFKLPFSPYHVSTSIFPFRHPISLVPLLLSSCFSFLFCHFSFFPSLYQYFLSPPCICLSFPYVILLCVSFLLSFCFLSPGFFYLIFCPLYWPLAVLVYLSPIYPHRSLSLGSLGPLSNQSNQP
jgi:hypothetical protein